MFKKLYFIYIFIVYIGGASVLTESDVLVFATFLLSFYLFIRSRTKFDIQIVYLLLLFCFINLISVVVFGPEVSINVFIGYCLRILTVYFTIKYLNRDFFELFKRGIFIIAIISVPFYLVQLFDINFFINNFPGINMSGELRTSVNYWNFFIYTAHQGTFNGIARNTGFGIEPGHFGYLLGFAIILELLDSDFKLNKKIIFNILIGLTTFSTTFYIVLALILILIQINSAKKSTFGLILLPVILYASYIIFSSEIISDKVVKTINSNEYTKQIGYDKYKTGEILNRVGMFEVGFDNFINMPFGHGLNPAGLKKNSYRDILAGPNSFAWLLTYWGIFFLVALPIMVLRFFKIYAPKLNTLSRALLLIIIVIYLNSSILIRDFVFYLIMIVPIANIYLLPSYKTKLLKYPNTMKHTQDHRQII